ncbi:hypothetical protein EJ06DRAFT_550787 [Trichodelitschia bisporula]|uniref:Uncharacterized protein n=1 Tax=Trichodelitschia bisporula TaxID=703511 RepID=A0A6G1HP09_9PEZI|nr:hypothetical protein EJ06DRAFT_550787 [Trichodelitschia bisporula]
MTHEAYESACVSPKSMEAFDLINVSHSLYPTGLLPSDLSKNDREGYTLPNVHPYLALTAKAEAHHRALSATSAVTMIHNMFGEPLASPERTAGPTKITTVPKPEYIPYREQGAHEHSREAPRSRKQPPTKEQQKMTADSVSTFLKRTRSTRHLPSAFQPHWGLPGSAVAHYLPPLRIHLLALPPRHNPTAYCRRPKRQPPKGRQKAQALAPARHKAHTATSSYDSTGASRQSFAHRFSAARTHVRCLAEHAVTRPGVASAAAHQTLKLIARWRFLSAGMLALMHMSLGNVPYLPPSRARRAFAIVQPPPLSAPRHAAHTRAVERLRLWREANKSEPGGVG